MTPKRNPLLATFLSLITPGLGQLYNGQPDKGLTFYLIGMVLVCSGISFGVSTFTGLVISCFIQTAFEIFILVDAWRSARNIDDRPRAKYQHWLVYLFLFLLNVLVVKGLETSFKHYKSFANPSISMMPALYKGDKFYVDLKAFKDAEPRRGDIIVFKYPIDNSTFMVKRVVGIPGDTLVISSKDIVLNGAKVSHTEIPMEDNLAREAQKIDDQSYELVSESFEIENHKVIYSKTENHIEQESIKVPAESYYVLGDNRDHANDSRVWGVVSKKNVVGKVVYIWFPLNRANALKMPAD